MSARKKQRVSYREKEAEKDKPINLSDMVLHDILSFVVNSHVFRTASEGYMSASKNAKKDRLSDLPDCIIHRILSFLDIKYAVQTCILSKRWKNLWTHVFDLNFDSGSFNKMASFCKFLSEVLSVSNNSLSIRSFNLTSWAVINPSLMERILEYVTYHHIEHLNLSIIMPCKRPFRIPSCFYTATYLKTLKLQNCRFGDDLLQKPLSLTSLETLCLEELVFSSKNQCLDIFSGCPNLKDLSFFKCTIHRCNPDRAFNISSPQLAKLSIRESIVKREIVLLAPKLLSFTFMSPNLVWLSTSCYLPSLDNVYIDLKSLPMSNDLNFKRRFITILDRMVTVLFHANSVTFSDYTIKIFHTTFPRMIHWLCLISKWKYVKLNAGCFEATYLKNQPGLRVGLFDGSPSSQTMILPLPSHIDERMLAFLRGRG